MRRDNDQYFTEPAIGRILVANVPINGKVFECCAGTGNLTAELRSSPYVERVYANDIEYFPNLDYQMDATSPDLWNRVPHCRWTATNPPFFLALEILEQAWKYTDNVAFLLRWSWAEPTRKRKELLQLLEPNLTDLLVFGTPRPSFTDDHRTDTVTTAWFVWQKEPRHSNTRIRFISDWKDAQSRLLPLAP